MTLKERLRAFLARFQSNTRAYRFEGEREAHADLLRERRVSISLMSNVDANDPDQVRMASDIEDDSENRLIVLLGKARLTREEKWERDTIQAALASRRQALAGDQPVLEQRTTRWAPTRFLGPLAASPVLAILSSPITWIAMGLAAFGIQTARLEHAKGDLRDARADLAMSQRHLADAAETVRDLSTQVNRANAAASQTAETIEAERARRLRAEREARRIRNAIEQARAGESVDYGFGGVRDDGAVSPSPGGGDANGDHPG